MNTKLYSNLIAKGMSAADAAEIAAQHDEEGGDNRLDTAIDSMARLAKGQANLASVDDLRADFDARIAESESIVEAVVQAADRAIEASTSGTQAIAKSVVTMGETIRTQGKEIARLTALVESNLGAIAKSIGAAVDNGRAPAPPLSVDPVTNGVIDAPGDRLAKGTIVPSQVISQLNERFAASTDTNEKHRLAKAISRAGAGGAEQVAAEFGLSAAH